MRNVRSVPDFARIPFRAIHLYANQVLSALECAFTEKGDETLQHPPVFIIGPPRSGTTLLFQVFATCLEVGYLSNLHSLFFGAPSWVERITRLTDRGPEADFQSRFGRTIGFRSPSECRDYWYRFFRRRQHYVPLNEADPGKLGDMRRAVRAFINACQKPVLFKDLTCAMRLRPISTALPEALFIVVRRDLADNARSILNARKSVLGSYDRWFSIKPPEMETLRVLPNTVQVIEQITRILAVIDSDSSAIGPERFFQVEYERFCHNPAEVLGEFQLFMQMHANRLKERTSPPTSLKQSHGKPLEQTMEQSLRAYLQAAALAPQTDVQN